MKNQFNLFNVFVLVGTSILFSCNSNTRFTPIGLPGEKIFNSTAAAEYEFKLEPSVQSFEQIELEKNESNVSFQVKKDDGNLLEDISKSDYNIFENNQAFENFTQTKNTVQHAIPVDIAFVVDVTGSMEKTIESAKSRLINFIYNSREAGYRMRMCLVTFGDYVLKKCDRFYDSNPKDPATLKEVVELASEITKLRAISGYNDPGGTDYNENPMRALIETSTAAWLPTHQRFAVLITDDGFLYSPGNSGSVGSNAPKYAAVKQALIDSKMKVFAATPTLAGYDQKFGSQDGIVKISGGEWFSFPDLVSGAITLDTILNRILFNVNTTFMIDYVSEDQPGLDPSLPIAKRKISIQLKNPALGEPINIALKSNFADGGKEYPKVFKLTEKAIDLTTLVVKINGQATDDYKLSKENAVIFKSAPRAKSKIVVTYEYANAKDSIHLAPVKISKMAILQTLKIYLNGVRAEAKHFTVTAVEESYSAVNLTDEVFADKDPFNIQFLKKLNVKVEYSVKAK